MNRGAPFVSLEVSAAGLKGAVLLNGVPVYETEDGTPRFVQSMVNHWVGDGANAVQIQLAAAEGPVAPAFTARLVRGTFGMAAPAAQSWFDYRWSAARAPVAGGDPRPVLDQRVRIDHPYDPWAWQSAARRTALDPRDGMAIRRLVVQLHRALTLRNTQGFIALVQQRNQEMATAFDLPYADVATDLATALQGFFQSSGWSVAPLRDPDADVVLRPLAEGRLVEARAPDGGPVLRGTDGTRSFTFPVMASCLDDTWTVVR